jgi:hypothetical protein
MLSREQGTVGASPREPRPRPLAATPIKLHTVLLADINHFVSRHRRITALAGVIVVFGVAALNAHAALPEHHDDHGKATMCIAALSIAVLAAVGFCTKRSFGLRVRVGWTPLLRALSSVTVDVSRVRARAGPPAPTVLRL